MSDAVYDAVFDSLEHAFSHGSTFAPNDYASVAGLATLRELDDRQLVEESRRLGELLLERTRPLVERYEVAKEVRGLGLMWAIEFGEPDSGSKTWRVLERMQPGIFAQLVVGPLFTDHRVLSQVAGHKVNIVKGLPSLTITEEDVDWLRPPSTRSSARRRRWAGRRRALRSAPRVRVAAQAGRYGSLISAWRSAMQPDAQRSAIVTSRPASSPTWKSSTGSVSLGTSIRTWCTSASLSGPNS